MKKLPYGFLKKLSETSGIAKPTLSAYLAGTKAIGRKNAQRLELSGEKIPQLKNISAADWIFKPEKIKKQIIDQANKVKK